MTKENFDKIAKGMNREALTNLLGTPTPTPPTRPGPPGAEDCLVWQDGATKIIVTTADGLSVSKFSTQPWAIVYPDLAKNPPAADKPALPVTRENFDKIDKDMTKKDLIALLGAPKETQGNDVDGALTWKDDGGTIFVFLARGKSNAKMNQQGWPVVYPGEAAKRPAEAKPFLEKQPDENGVAAHAASCFWRAGDPARARSLFEAMIRDHPAQAAAIQEARAELERDYPALAS